MSNAGFLGEQSFIPLTITADWLDTSRCWIRKKFFYMRGDELIRVNRCDCCKRADAVYPVRKYRFLGYMQTIRAFRILPLNLSERPASEGKR